MSFRLHSLQRIAIFAIVCATASSALAAGPLGYRKQASLLIAPNANQADVQKTTKSSRWLGKGMAQLSQNGAATVPTPKGTLKTFSLRQNNIKPVPFQNGNLGISGQGMPAQKNMASKLPLLPGADRNALQGLKYFNSQPGAKEMVQKSLKNTDRVSMPSQAAKDLASGKRSSKNYINGLSFPDPIGGALGGLAGKAAGEVLSEVGDAVGGGVGLVLSDPEKAVDELGRVLFEGPNFIPEPQDSDYDTGPPPVEKTPGNIYGKNFDSPDLWYGKKETKPTNDLAKEFVVPKIKSDSNAYGKEAAKFSPPPATQKPPVVPPQTGPSGNGGNGGRQIVDAVGGFLQNRSRGGYGYAAPVTYTEPQLAVAESGSVDLVLEDVKLVSEATLVAGPAYAVRFRNQSTQASGKFMVAAIASLDGQFHQDAPRAMLEVPGLRANETRDVVLRLPVTAMRMGTEQAAFSYLILAIDVTGAVDELDETNNNAAVDRNSL